MLHQRFSILCLLCLSTSPFCNFIWHFKGLDLVVEVSVFCSPLLFWHNLMIFFWLFYNLFFITQKHAYLGKLHGLYKNSSLKRKSGEERYLLNLWKTLHRGEGAIILSIFMICMVSSGSFDLVCYFFNAEETVPMLAQVQTECRVPSGVFCRSIIHWDSWVWPMWNKEESRKRANENYNLYIYFLHFALTFKFRKYVFTQETFKFLCQSQYSPLLPYPIALYCWESWFF